MHAAYNEADAFPTVKTSIEVVQRQRPDPVHDIVSMSYSYARLYHLVTAIDIVSSAYMNASLLVLWIVAVTLHVSCPMLIAI